MQKIQFFGRFDCGHLLNISHICKDSDIQKIPLPENTILSLGQNLNIIFPLHSTSRHFTSPPLCLPHFKPLCATSPHLPFCLPHLMTPSVIFASLHLTSRHFTSPILSGSLHATSRRLLCFSHSLHLISLHFSSPRVLSASLHSTSCHFASPCFICLTSCHFTPPPVIFTSLHATSLHLPFCLPHFTPLHATSPHLPFFLPHFMPLHSTSPPFFSPHFASPHLIHPPYSLRWQRFTKKVRKRPIQQTRPPAS